MISFEMEFMHFAEHIAETTRSRIFSFLCRSIISVLDQGLIKENHIENLEYSAEAKITKEMHLPKDYSDLERENLIYTFNKFEEFKEKLGLDVEFAFYIHKNAGLALVSEADTIEITREFLSLSHAEIDFVCGHELQHYVLAHISSVVAFDMAMGLIDLLCFITYPPLILVAESAAYFLENSLSRCQEKQADLKSIELNGTNEGALLFFKNAIDSDAKELIECFGDETYRTKFSEEEFFELEKLVCNYSHITHPNNSSRYDYCLEFSFDA